MELSAKDILMLRILFLKIAHRFPTDSELSVLIKRQEEISYLNEFSEKVREKLVVKYNREPTKTEINDEIGRDPNIGGVGEGFNTYGAVAKLIFDNIPLEKGQYLWGLHSGYCGIFVDMLDPLLPKDEVLDPYLQAAVSMTLQHERTHQLKFFKYFKIDVPFATSIGWCIFHEVLTRKGISPFDIKSDINIGKINFLGGKLKESYDKSASFADKYLETLTTKTDFYISKYRNLNNEPPESYDEGLELATIALRLFDDPLQCILYFENVCMGKSASEALGILENDNNRKIHNQIRQDMIDPSMWDFVIAGQSFCDQHNVKDDKFIRGSAIVNILNSLESGLNADTGVAKIPRFLYLRPPLI